MVVLVGLAACGTDGADDNIGVSAHESHQGTSYEGTSTSYDGTMYAGMHYLATSSQGASYGGSGLSSVQVDGTAVSTWRRTATGWEQRLPDRTCRWDLLKTFRSCTTTDLATHASPLAGTSFQATFAGPTGTLTGTVRIGSAIGSVQRDTSKALFPLDGAGATGPVESCDDKLGACRVNSDLWLYDVQLLDTSGHTLPFCPAGTWAFALAGTWDATGKHAASSARFTFACTTGTIAKCTRWGYRPWASATMNDHVTTASLADYHQACVRAATADYCANGHSFTQDGTLVDIYDYQGSGPGFIARTRGTLVASEDATAFTWESTFDKDGGLWIEHLRYAELAGTSGYGSIGEQCPGRFDLGTTEQGAAYMRPDGGTYPHISIDSTPGCSHSEATIGKWLHHACSRCTDAAPASCTDAASTGWDASCASWASTNCTSVPHMGAHSECATGVALPALATGCTLHLSLDPSYASCFTTGWTASCVAAANAHCKGGREHVTLGRTYGFCNTQYVPETTSSL